jgi:hypothetical protein
MPYPIRQQTPNGYQVAGQALTQAAGQFNEFQDRQAKARALMEEMVANRQKRALEQLQAQREAERQAQQLEISKAEETRKADEAKRGQQFRDKVAGQVISKTLAADPGLSRSSKSVVPGGPTQAEIDDLGNVQGMQLPNQNIGGSDSTQMMGQALDRMAGQGDMANGKSPMTDDEMLLEGLRLGQISPENYYQLKTKTTKPVEWSTIKTTEGWAQVHPHTGEIRKLGVKPTQEGPGNWQITDVNGRKVQVNPQTGEQRDLGAVTPKVNPKAAQNIKDKLQTLTLAKQQLAKVQASFDKIKNTGAAGPKWTGQGMVPSEAGSLFDADVDGLRQTIRSLTRTPGEGSMSDWEGKLAGAANPDRKEYESATQRKIDNLSDMIALLESGYGRMHSEAENPDAAGNQKPVRQVWERDPATGKMRIKQ